MTVLPIRICATVYISWGKWVARCPADGCPQAEHYGADPDTGHVGGLTDSTFRCGHCGMFCAAEWPDPDVAADVVALLGMRPVPATRSWLPGETVENLLAENVEHKLLSAEELLPGEFTMGDAIPVMLHGLMTPHVRQVVAARARGVLAAETHRGVQLRADQLLAIGA